MTRRIYYILASAAFAVAVFLFFFLAYPFHICHQEQCQLFEFTSRYLWETIFVPGGLADYLGRFFTQFFVSAAFGSLVLSLILTGIQIVTVWICKTKTALIYALSFAAPILFVIFFCDGDAMISAPIAVLCSLLAAKGVLSIRKLSSRRVAAALCVIPLFCLLGSASVVFLVAVLADDHNPWSAAVMAVLFLACPIVIHIIWGYPYFRLFYGVNYFRFHKNYSFFNWYATAALLAVLCVERLLVNLLNVKSGLVTFITLVVLGTAGVILSFNGEMEQFMKYDILSGRFQWKTIVKEAEKDNPSMIYPLSVVNLALVKTGNIAHMFEYHQVGENGLLPEYVNDYMLSWIPSEAYFQLGMINDCQRHTFEAQELMPDAQKSARAYKRLAETNLVNGHYNVARKYLRPLTHTSIYRHWANHMLKMIESGDSAKLDEGYEYLRSVRLKGEDFLFNHNAMEAMLVYLVHENPSNNMALDYLLMWDLLSRNLDGFMRVCPFTGYKVVCKPFQEAYLLAVAQNENALSALPDFISQQNVKAFAGFVNARNSGADEQYLEKHFGDTYWFYYFYRTVK